MSVPGTASAAASDTFVFAPFRLDLRAGQLTRGGTPIALRPKTWSVLVYLAERPGVLVTKEELLDAVWPDVAVTPDTLTKSIGELRLALGDDSANPGYIATVHRRGFRFIAPAGAAPPSQLAVDWQAPSGELRPFVGRAAEMRRLNEHFARAAAGERQLLFLTGPAGVGKTTLVDTFLDLPALHGAGCPVWIARGTCVEQHGPGEPYMPVLQAIERLAHRADGNRLVALLRRMAPTWLAQMPWLIADDAEGLRQSLQAARAERMLREFAALVEALTAELTLVLVLEDLHWSDPATVDLLTLLGERREPARLLVIGTHRPAEVAVSEHVLGGAVRGMQLRAQCSELPLHELGVDSVATYLTQRFPGAELPPTLAKRLHTHTDGNPLFVVSVVDHMLSRGWILDTAPGWSFVGDANAVDLGLPDDAHRMIATQVGSLPPADRTLLEAASVAGLEFTAQVVAAALRSDLDEVESRCEALARPQRFLRFAGSEDWPNGNTALRYAFAHELFRGSIYEEIPAGRRQRLHQRIGEALEAAYGERAEDHASTLATHFERAGDHLRAHRYLAAAAARARRRFATREALGFLEAALRLSEHMLDDPQRRRLELERRLEMAALLSELHSFTSQQLRRNCERAYELCREVGSPEQLFTILHALAYAHGMRADADRAPAVLRELGEVAARLGTAHRVLADSLLVRTTFLFGDCAGTCRRMDGPLGEQLREACAATAGGYGPEPAIATDCSHALALWFVGHIERAQRLMHAALAASTAPGVSPFTQAAVLGHAAILAAFNRQPERARMLAARLSEHTNQHEIALWRAIATALAGWAMAEGGDVLDGIGKLEAAHAEFVASDIGIFSTHVLAFLAGAQLRGGLNARALASVDKAIQLSQSTLDRTYVPELWRLRGEILLAQAAAAPRGRKAQRHDEAVGAAQDALLRAVESARRSEQRALELRAATSLARAWGAVGRAEEARRLLSQICEWFAATASSPDLTDARAVLQQLPRMSRPSRATRIR